MTTVYFATNRANDPVKPHGYGSQSVPFDIKDITFAVADVTGIRLPDENSGTINAITGKTPANFSSGATQAIIGAKKNRQDGFETGRSFMPKFAHYAVFAIAALTVAALWPAHAKDTPSDAEIRQQIIQDSIANYPGRCPCPYNVMRNGRSCGGRSAYSRPGGYAPLCYANDVSDEMVKDYRKSHGH